VRRGVEDGHMRGALGRGSRRPENDWACAPILPLVVAGMLNRAALIVRPAKPYLDWAAGLDDSGLPPSPDDEQTVYLVPEFEDDEEREAVLEMVWAELFERELFDWHINADDWPQNRTLAMFREWFRIEMHSIVEDMVDGPLEDDGLDED
jgi:hypothetical protein